MLPCYQGGGNRRKWAALSFDAGRSPVYPGRVPFSSLEARKTAHDYPDPAPFGWYWERRSSTLRRILASGGWSVHDIINRPHIRSAVNEQWRLVLTMRRDRDMNAYFRYLEYLEDISPTSRI